MQQLYEKDQMMRSVIKDHTLCILASAGIHDSYCQAVKCNAIKKHGRLRVYHSK